MKWYKILSKRHRILRHQNDKKNAGALNFVDKVSAGASKFCWSWNVFKFSWKSTCWDIELCRQEKIWCIELYRRRNSLSIEILHGWKDIKCYWQNICCHHILSTKSLIEHQYFENLKDIKFGRQVSWDMGHWFCRLESSWDIKVVHRRVSIFFDKVTAAVSKM